jgi:hypothetical protein
MATTVDSNRTTDVLTPLRPGDPKLIDHPIAQQLLQAIIPARLGYVTPDGVPRVVPMLFHWTGTEVVVTSWPDDPKVAALRTSPAVSVTIDTDQFPFHVLSLRGEAAVTIIDGVADECLPTFSRYFGPDEGRGWVERMRMMSDQQARISIRPDWVNVVDFQTRFPIGMTKRMRPA